MEFFFSIIGLCIYVALILVGMLFQTLTEVVPDILAIVLAVGIFIVFSYLLIILALNVSILLKNQINEVKSPLISFNPVKTQAQFERYMQEREQGKRKAHFLEIIWKTFFYIFLFPPIAVISFVILAFPFMLIIAVSNSVLTGIISFIVVLGLILYSHYYQKMKN